MQIKVSETQGIFVLVCVIWCVCGVDTPQHAWGGKRITCRNWFSPSTNPGLVAHTSLPTETSHWTPNLVHGSEAQLRQNSCPEGVPESLSPIPNITRNIKIKHHFFFLYLASITLSHLSCSSNSRKTTVFILSYTGIFCTTTYKDMQITVPRGGGGGDL